MITALDHIQIAHPAGAEDGMRAYYCDLLGMTEIPKPAPLRGRGSFWAMAGPLQVHFGVDPDFKAATKAHPAFIIADLDALAKRLEQVGAPVRWDSSLPDTRRFFTADPVGNLIECMAA